MTLMKVNDISPCISDLPAHKPLPFLPCTSSSPPFTLFTPGSSGFEEWPSSGFFLKQNSFHVLNFSLFPEFILMKYIFIDAFFSNVLDQVAGLGICWWFNLLFICWFHGLCQAMLWNIYFFFSFFVNCTSHGSMYMWEICVCYHLINLLIGL